jgi:hypothetical protein
LSSETSSAWLRSQKQTSPDADVCPQVSKQQFTPDSARYCLKDNGGTCTSFRVKPFDDCLRRVKTE